jgi:hypothetical protein
MLLENQSPTRCIDRLGLAPLDLEETILRRVEVLEEHARLDHFVTLPSLVGYVK